MSIESIDPTTGRTLETFAETTPAELEGILAAAEAAFLDWHRRPFAERAGRMREAARRDALVVLTEHRDQRRGSRPLPGIVLTTDPGAVLGSSRFCDGRNQPFGGRSRGAA